MSDDDDDGPPVGESGSGGGDDSSRGGGANGVVVHPGHVMGMAGLMDGVGEHYGSALKFLREHAMPEGEGWTGLLEELRGSLTRAVDKVGDRQQALRDNAHVMKGKLRGAAVQYHEQDKASAATFSDNSGDGSGPVALNAPDDGSGAGGGDGSDIEAESYPGLDDIDFTPPEAPDSEVLEQLRQVVEQLSHTGVDAAIKKLTGKSLVEEALKPFDAQWPELVRICGAYVEAARREREMGGAVASGRERMGEAWQGKASDAAQAQIKDQVEGIDADLAEGIGLLLSNTYDAVQQIMGSLVEYLADGLNQQGMYKGQPVTVAQLAVNQDKLAAEDIEALRDPLATFAQNAHSLVEGGQDIVGEARHRLENIKPGERIEASLASFAETKLMDGPHGGGGGRKKPKVLVETLHRIGVTQETNFKGVPHQRPIGNYTNEPPQFPSNEGGNTDSVGFDLGAHTNGGERIWRGDFATHADGGIPSVVNPNSNDSLFSGPAYGQNSQLVLPGQGQIDAAWERLEEAGINIKRGDGSTLADHSRWLVTGSLDDPADNKNLSLLFTSVRGPNQGLVSDYSAVYDVTDMMAAKYDPIIIPGVNQLSATLDGDRIVVYGNSVADGHRYMWETPPIDADKGNLRYVLEHPEQWYKADGVTAVGLHTGHPDLDKYVDSNPLSGSLVKDGGNREAQIFKIPGGGGYGVLDAERDDAHIYGNWDHERAEAHISIKAGSTPLELANGDMTTLISSNNRGTIESDNYMHEQGYPLKDEYEMVDGSDGRGADAYLPARDNQLPEVYGPEVVNVVDNGDGTSTVTFLASQWVHQGAYRTILYTVKIENG